VRGNLVDGFGMASAVSVAAGGSVTISDNRCLLKARSTDPVIEIAAGAAIVNANYVERDPNDDRTVAIETTTVSGAATLVGNLCTGRIILDGASLGAPWLALNPTVKGV
jgi:hypothetical protein